MLQIISSLTYIKNSCLDHRALNNYRHVLDICFIGKVMEKNISCPTFFPIATHTNFPTHISEHIVMVTALNHVQCPVPFY